MYQGNSCFALLFSMCCQNLLWCIIYYMYFHILLRVARVKINLLHPSQSVSNPPPPYHIFPKSSHTLLEPPTPFLHPSRYGVRQYNFPPNSLSLSAQSRCQEVLSKPQHSMYLVTHKSTSGVPMRRQMYLVLKVNPITSLLVSHTRKDDNDDDDKM